MNYSFDKDQIEGGRGETPFIANPGLEEIYYYCKYVIISGRMEKEIPYIVHVPFHSVLPNIYITLNPYKHNVLLSIQSPGMGIVYFERLLIKSMGMSDIMS